MAQSTPDDGLPQVTLVVLGAQGVGKSTFVQNSFDLRSPTTSAFAVKKMSLDDMVYLVRLVEVSLDDIVVTESSRIKWPKSLEGVDIPPVDGVLALYDVTNQQSITGIPDLLRWSPTPSLHSASYPLVHAKSRLQDPLPLVHPRNFRLTSLTDLIPRCITQMWSALRLGVMQMRQPSSCTST
jgi:GTPase SAR1 family protein